MKFRINSLTLQCKKSREVIDFSSQITFFYGQTSSGKSSILRLIDFCFAGDLEKTPAIKSEAINATLCCTINSNEIILSRDINSNQITISWTNSSGQFYTISAPIDTSQVAIWEGDIYNFSDMMFYFMGITPIWVKRNKTDDEAPLIRLSFRDILWYCYLDQTNIDSTFFWLGEDGAFKRPKSRDVMRFVMGYYTERLNHLEQELEETKDERKGCLLASNEIKKFLRQFGYESEMNLVMEIEKARKELSCRQGNLGKVREDYNSETHFADDLRQQLREKVSTIAELEEALEDNKRVIFEHESLLGELTSAKFKLAKSQAATEVFNQIGFDMCPECGTEIEKHISDEMCSLCGKHKKPDDKIDPQVVNKDLDIRILELKDSLGRHSKNLNKIVRELNDKKSEKMALDNRYNEEMINYDSMYMASFREAERKVAELEERIRGLEKVSEMPIAVRNLESRADSLLALEQRLKREIKEEKSTLTDAISNVKLLETKYAKGLVTVGVPGVNKSDEVSINIKNWIASILPSGDEALKWDFYNAGSNGRKTLLKVIYCLALHQVSEIRELPLPPFIIIDYPMKNIGDDVNRDLFESFFNYLFGLAKNELSKTQFILVDNELVEPKGFESFTTRYMTREESANPPLISYYRGEIG